MVKVRSVPKCEYCGSGAANRDIPTPESDDDFGWWDVGLDHNKDCEWVVTRAHTRDRGY